MREVFSLSIYDTGFLVAEHAKQRSGLWQKVWPMSETQIDH